MLICFTCAYVDSTAGLRSIKEIVRTRARVGAKLDYALRTSLGGKVFEEL